MRKAPRHPRGCVRFAGPWRSRARQSAFASAVDEASCSTDASGRKAAGRPPATGPRRSRGPSRAARISARTSPRRRMRRPRTPGSARARRPRRPVAFRREVIEAALEARARTVVSLQGLAVADGLARRGPELRRREAEPRHRRAKRAGAVLGDALDDELAAPAAVAGVDLAARAADAVVALGVREEDDGRVEVAARMPHSDRSSSACTRRDSCSWRS